AAWEPSASRAEGSHADGVRVLVRLSGDTNVPLVSRRGCLPGTMRRRYVHGVDCVGYCDRWGGGRVVGSPRTGTRPSAGVVVQRFVRARYRRVVRTGGDGPGIAGRVDTGHDGAVGDGDARGATHTQ